VDAPNRPESAVTAVLLLALGCGLVAGAPLVVGARRGIVVRRGAALTQRSRPGRRRLLRPGAAVVLAQLPVLRVLASIGRTRRARERGAAMRRELPVALDLLAVAVRSGATPYLAVELVAPWAPPTIAPVLRDITRRCSLGATFVESLERAGRADDGLAPLVAALSTSERFGAPVGDRLSERAADARAAWRRLAEAHARRVPVRLLFPLVFLVLPAFAALTVVPELLAGFGAV
jgi:tight adherence protein C